MRSLGIPARVITNFNSAHDNTGNLKTELIFLPDGSPDKRRTRDSIWWVCGGLSRELSGSGEAVVQTTTESGVYRTSVLIQNSLK